MGGEDRGTTAALKCGEELHAAHAQHKQTRSQSRQTQPRGEAGADLRESPHPKYVACRSASQSTLWFSPYSIPKVGAVTHFHRGRKLAARAMVLLRRALS